MKEKQLKKLKEEFRYSVVSLMDLEGMKTNDVFARLVANNFEYYAEKLLDKDCDHEPQITEVEENGYKHHVNGNVCVKCQQLL